MSVLSELRTRAAAHPAHVVLSEGEDSRIIAAAIEAVETGLGSITLVGSTEIITKKLAAVGGSLSEALRVEDPASSNLMDQIAAGFFELRKHKGVSEDVARKMAGNPLVFAAMMVKLGLADGTVGGAVATTSDTVRAALQAIGKAPDQELVSSFFLMVLPEGHPSGRRAMVFSDSGLVIDPSSPELASIAAQSARSYEALLNEPAKIAFLSFSTKGSARHERVSKVSEAAAMLSGKHPELESDGELQFDAAFVPQVGESKAPGSKVAGQANVMIFPNLDAGNIGYKIAQRVGGCEAIGPILQGLDRPANDLSRGCTAEDVVNMIAVTALQAAAR